MVSIQEWFVIKSGLRWHVFFFRGGGGGGGGLRERSRAKPRLGLAHRLAPGAPYFLGISPRAWVALPSFRKDFPSASSLGGNSRRRGLTWGATHTHRKGLAQHPEIRDEGLPRLASSGARAHPVGQDSCRSPDTTPGLREVRAGPTWEHFPWPTQEPGVSGCVCVGGGGGRGRIGHGHPPMPAVEPGPLRDRAPHAQRPRTPRHIRPQPPKRPEPHPRPEDPRWRPCGTSSPGPETGSWPEGISSRRREQESRRGLPPARRFEPPPSANPPRHAQREGGGRSRLLEPKMAAGARALSLSLSLALPLSLSLCGQGPLV